MGIILGILLCYVKEAKHRMASQEYEGTDHSGSLSKQLEAEDSLLPSSTSIAASPCMAQVLAIGFSSHTLRRTLGWMSPGRVLLMIT